MKSLEYIVSIGQIGSSLNTYKLMTIDHSQNIFFEIEFKTTKIFGRQKKFVKNAC